MSTSSNIFGFPRRWSPRRWASAAGAMMVVVALGGWSQAGQPEKPCQNPCSAAEPRSPDWAAVPRSADRGSGGHCRESVASPDVGVVSWPSFDNAHSLSPSITVLLADGGSISRVSHILESVLGDPKRLLQLTVIGTCLALYLMMRTRW